ncbi:MAG: hypothetical protein ACI4M0_05265 [Christensenellales bacterium]
MESKPIKKIKTSCPFPMLEYKVDVLYNEVRKASGIAYILLELIQKSAMGNEKIAVVLKRFGIPSDLHYIFAKELSSLVANGILDTRINSSYIDNIKYFEQMTLDLFKLTAKGRKMFAEGAIPTGQEKAKTTHVFYSPVTRKFDLVCTQSYAPLETSFLGEDFLDKVKYDVSGMEEYLKFVQTKVGLKAEEMIVKITYQEPKKLAAKAEENLTITIDTEGADFSFATTDEKAFFERYYSSSLMSAGMLMKDKYKFDVSVPTVDWSSIKADNLYIPSDAGKQAARPCKLFIGRGVHGYTRTDNVLRYENGSSYLDVLDDKAEFALLDNAGCKYYLPLNVRIPCKNFGDVFEMQLLVETVASDEQFKKVLQAIYLDCYERSYSSESSQTLAYIATVLGDSELLNKYTQKKISELGTDEDRIDLLLRLNASFSKCEGWNAYFTEIANVVFERYVASVELENIIFKNTVLTPLHKAMEMPEAEYISVLAEPLKEKESAELVYQALESASFGESEILAVVNVIDIYATRVLERTPIDGATELARKFALYSSNLWKLCDMLGVESPNDYTLKDDYNIDEFFNTFATYSKAQKDVEKYKAYAKTSFEQLHRFDAIFNPVQEILSIERTASEHPEKITKEFIDEQISRGRYSVAISNLLIKAQYDLRILLSADLTVGANELIDEAESQGIIERDEANCLHKLRMCRNGLQHPEKRQIPFDKATLEEWRDTVFSLKGEQN